MYDSPFGADVGDTSGVVGTKVSVVIKRVQQDFFCGSLVKNSYFSIVMSFDTLVNITQNLRIEGWQMGNGHLDHIRNFNDHMSSGNGRSSERVIETLRIRTIVGVGVTYRRSMRRGGVWV